jgi:nucleoside-diphosphate-sugar epimerase
MLQQAGHEVVGLDSDIFRRCTFGAEPPPLEERIKDVRDVELGDVEGFDAVLHLAGLSNDPLGDLDPELTYEINHRASVRLAELSKRAGVKRFVFSSSCSNYGAGGNDLLDEDGALNPVTPYGKSKVLVEQDVSPLASDDFTPVYLRNATAYGVSPRLRFDLVLNNLTAWAFTTGKVRLKSDGTPWRPLVHIEDISRAFLAVLTAPKEVVSDKAFNVGVPNENFRIREIAETVRDTVPDSTVTFAEGASADTRNYRVDCTRLPKLVPEYRPQWTVQRGAGELYDAFKSSDLTLAAFEGERYKRVAHLQLLMDKGIIDHKLRHTGVE